MRNRATEQGGAVPCFSARVGAEVDEETRAPLKSVEILRRARLDGYEGGKSAIYGLIAELRPDAAQLMMRFEGLPGEFSQHGFAEVRIIYVDGSCEVAGSSARG